MVHNFTSILYTPVGRALMDLTLSYLVGWVRIFVGWGRIFSCLLFGNSGSFCSSISTGWGQASPCLSLGYSGSTVGFILLQNFSRVV